MNEAKRLGVYGGSFDPPHTAHIALAKHAVAQFVLDELRIIPTGDSWHKARALTPSPHRLAMTRLAFADVPQAVVDPREIDRQGATYTVDTLEELKAEQPEADLYLFIGADQAHAFQTWHRWQDIVGSPPWWWPTDGKATQAGGSVSGTMGHPPTHNAWTCQAWM